MATNSRYYILFALLTCILFSIGAYFKFHKQNEKLPVGCDEFGYLNMAKAFGEQNFFNDHAPRQFFLNLVDTLQQENIPELEYKWMLTPHAYHFSAQTKEKVINQYPPATSFVLSLIPFELRKTSFPFLTLFLTFLIPLLIAYFFLSIKNKKILLALSILMVLISLTVPFKSSLTMVNSLALTFGLFIAAGLTAKEHKFIALFCIVLAANFRIVNLLMLAPLSFYFLPEFMNYLTTKKWMPLLKMFLKAISISLMGISPYLFYVTLLLGNPLIPTYPSHDTAFVNANELISNVFFYINIKDSWFRLLLICISILLIQVKFKQLNLKEFWLLMTFPIFNYLFFIFHKMQINYYPFASSFILIGAIIFYFSKSKLIFFEKKAFIFIPLLLSSIMLIDGINRYFRKEHITFEESLKTYQSVCNYDVVWGEMYSGTAEYVCNNNGFKYVFGSEKARAISFNYLKNHNYSQVIICDDVILSTQEIVDELNNLSLPHKIIEDKTLGKLIIIN